MKKILSAVLAVSMIFVGCKKDPILVGSITLNQSVASIVEGETLKLTATVTPNNAENQEIRWSSDNTAVATVDASGTVSAVKSGSAKITAAASDASGVKATCQVTVTDKAILITKIDLAYTEYSLKKGETVKLTAAVTPADATNQAVNFVSSNPGVASVNATTGEVTAISAGTTNIVAEAADGSGVKSAACVITVTEPKSILLTFKKAVMRVGGKDLTQKAWYGTIDSWADRDDITSATWASANTAVVSNDNATFKAVAPGETTASLTDAEGNTATWAIKVLAPTVKPADYYHGVKLVATDNVTGWKTKPSTFELGEGYVAGTQRLTNANLDGYKIAEVNFYDRPCDASKIQNPALYLRLYIEDVTKLTLNGAGEIELRSNMNSAYDESEEICWPWPYWCADATNAHAAAKQHLKNGWNNIVLPFALSHQGQTTSDLAGFRAGKINYLRIFQDPAGAAPNTKVIVDEARIIDWTEVDNCDNFDMWYDRMTPNNSFLSELDEADKKEGKGSFAVVDHLINGPVSNYRLEMWPGLEYALPADLDLTNAALKFWLYVSDGAAFQGMHTVVELASDLMNDRDNFSWPILPGNIKFQTGWNEIKINFSDANVDTKEGSKADLRKINYFRIVFTPQGAPVNYYTYKIDDIRVVKK